MAGNSEAWFALGGAIKCLEHKMCELEDELECVKECLERKLCCIECKLDQILANQEKVTGIGVVTNPPTPKS